MPSAPISPRSADSYLGFAQQSVKGTGVVPTFFATYMNAVELDVGMNVRKIREAGGAFTPARHVKDSYIPGVQFALPVRPDEGAAIMAYLLGTAGSPSGGADPYTHTITNSELTRWLSIERSIADDVIERMVDAFITQVVLDIRKRDEGPEAMLTVTAGSLDVVKGVTATAESYEVDTPFLRSECAWTIDSSAVTNVERATLTFTYEYDEGILADAITRANAVKIGLDAQIEVVNLYESAADLAAYEDIRYGSGSPQDTVTEFVHRGDFTVNMSNTRGAASAARQFQVAIPEVDWIDAIIDPVDPEGTEALRLTRRGELMANPGAEPITVTAQNARATAYVS